MVAMSTWLRYLAQKFDYSVSVCWKSYKRGKLSRPEMGDAIWRTFLQGKLTYMSWDKGEQMAPMIGSHGSTLLIRRLPFRDPTCVGDVVVFKDPENSENQLVRRVAALEGYEMVSADEKEESFVLAKDQCWVLADNKAMNPKEALDSRTFGPVSTSELIGRVIYCLRNAVDHGPVQNSQISTRRDLPVLEVELDVDEMAKYHRAS